MPPEEPELIEKELKSFTETAQLPKKGRLKDRKFLIGLIVFLLMSFGVFYATGSFTFNVNGFAGSITVDEIIFVDGIYENNEPVNPARTTFDATERIEGLVKTSGVDASIGMKWYHEDTLVLELFGRPLNNRFSTYIEGSQFNPIDPGNYRVDVVLLDGGVVETEYFTVNEYEQSIEINPPPQPAPAGHQDIEGSPYFEIPFIFDEVWDVDGIEYKINEVKITFFDDDVFFVIVVDAGEFDSATAMDVAKPIAQYAVQNGYYEQAKQIEIAGKRYNFDTLPGAITVTLFNKLTNRGYRANFDHSDVSN